MKEKNNIKNIFKWKNIFVSLGVVVIVYILVLFVEQTISNVQMQYQVSEMRVELAEIENQNRDLHEQLEQSTTDQYIEEQARENLGMVAPGEDVVEVVEEENKLKKEAIEGLKPQQKMSVYIKDWYKMLGEEFHSWIN